MPSPTLPRPRFAGFFGVVFFAVFFEAFAREGFALFRFAITDVSLERSYF
jgi:hypothetical protein